MIAAAPAPETQATSPDHLFTIWMLRSLLWTAMPRTCKAPVNLPETEMTQALSLESAKDHYRHMNDLLDNFTLYYISNRRERRYYGVV